MTLKESLDLLGILYDSDSESLNVGDDDYTIRQSILNSAITTWGTQELWRELLVTPTSPDTTDGVSKQFLLPSDFKEMSGYVRLRSPITGSDYYEQIEPTSLQLYDNNTTAKKYYITGNTNDGFYLNFLEIPTADLEILYEYYKEPTLLSNQNDSIEMSDPMFAIYFTLSRLYEGDSASSKSMKAYQEASAIMENMILKNSRLGWLQSDSIPDGDAFSGFSGFGK